MNAVASIPPANSLIVRMAQQYGVEPDKMLHTLRETAFKNATNEQLMALMIVSEKYSLNPWLKEIFAFPSQNGGIVPVVGLDGWSRIINSDPRFDGMEFVDGLDDKGNLVSIECVIYRKDRAHPVKVREYMAECKRDTQPWKSHPRRMLRHKAMIQCSRVAFGFAGIYDPDEAERIVEADRPVITPQGDVSHIPQAEVDKHVSAVTDILNSDADEYTIADMLRNYHVEYFDAFPEVGIAVADKLKKDGIISKGDYKQYLKLERPEDEDRQIPMS